VVGVLENVLACGRAGVLACWRAGMGMAHDCHIGSSWDRLPKSFASKPGSQAAHPKAQQKSASGRQLTFGSGNGNPRRWIPDRLASIRSTRRIQGSRL
jgi:hypothetical protein